MAHLLHPTLKQITLVGVLDALADPLRLRIVKYLLENEGNTNCRNSAKCSISKSTLSNHFRILREAGVVRTTKRGVENLNTVRVEDLETKFPGLLKAVLANVD